MGATPVEMYKLFFGSQAMCPDLTEDAGLSCNCPDTQVSSLVPGLVIHIFVINLPLKVAKAKMIRCPAPLPETRPDLVLVRTLKIVPLEESEGGDKETMASSKEA